MSNATRTLAGKRALVVGASRGIGAGIARAAAAAGAHVVLGGRTHPQLDALAGEIEAAGGRASAVVVDIREEASVDAAFDQAAHVLGGIDVVVASGGISPIFKRIVQMSVEEWDEILSTNARGSFLIGRAAGRHLLPQGSGSLIFLTSIYEQVGGERLSAYAASKGAVRQLARSLALEWAAGGVRVNCIAPSYVETEMTEGLRQNEFHRDRLLAGIPVGRFGTTDEVAGAAVFLASDAARYITGTTLFVDGGWTAR
jgi:NAD(P)-dependent dehydrogenase (short-subunit alcohol dehydrogenase family)